MRARQSACCTGTAKTYGVPFERCGKIIVATDATQFETLRGYQRRAVANGVGELRWLPPEEVAELEPAVSCVGAVLSEIDRHHRQPRVHGEPASAISRRTTE